MRRRRFLSILAAAFVTPPLPVQEILERRLPKLKPIRLIAYEEIGISICNMNALTKVQFTNDLQIQQPNQPRDILPA